MNLLLARDLGPFLPGGQFRRVLGQEQDAGAPKAGIDSGVVLHVLPQAQRLAGKRDFGARAALLAAPAPIAARLLGADMPLLDQRDREPFLRQMIGRRNADHAAADDDDIGLRRQALVACYAAEGWGHETLLIEARWFQRSSVEFATLACRYTPLQYPGRRQASEHRWRPNGRSGEACLRKMSRDCFHNVNCILPSWDLDCAWRPFCLIVGRLGAPIGGQRRAS